jgi:hypothetical protein
MHFAGHIDQHPGWPQTPRYLRANRTTPLHFQVLARATRAKTALAHPKRIPPTFLEESFTQKAAEHEREPQIGQVSELRKWVIDST